MAPPLTEAQLLGCVRAAVSHYGIRCYHTHDSRRSEPGFPDLVLVGTRVMFRELKTRNGKLTLEQRAWIRALQAAAQDAGVWRPQDWPDGICNELLDIQP